MRSDVLADAVCANWVGPVFILSPSLYSARLYIQPVFALPSYDAAAFVTTGSPSRSWRSQRRLVEPDGIEPTTSCLQSTRSPS